MSTDATNTKPGASTINLPEADTGPLDAKLYTADDFGGVADSIAGSGSLSYSALQAQQASAQQDGATGAVRHATTCG
jgi:hypothetical protein